MPQAKQAALSNSAVRQQVEKIVAHGLFARSERMGRFLRLAVERVLDGKADELKEYLIGVEVFDRKPSYDPRVDPIVRVEARRLRSKLKAYYDGDGRSDRVIIEFIPGSYAPRLQLRNEILPPLQGGDSSRPDPATVAVLPFTNLSPVPENEYFSDGLTEELIHALTKLPGLRVVAWNTAAQLRDRQQDMPAIRSCLKVGTVLTGSVRISGSSLRVRVQLIDTETGVYLWSETFDRDMRDIFAIQEEIARATVRTLRVQLGAERETALVGRGRTSISSYDWYLKGRHAWHRRTPQYLQKSLECFQNAVSADGDSALAYAGLADAYILLVDYGLMHPADGIPRAKAAAEKSIRLDPELSEPHVSLAFIRGTHEWHWQESEQIYKRAIELNPGYSTAHQWLGCDHYAMLGRFEEALTEANLAVQLDPLSSIIVESRNYVLMLSRRYAEAIEGYRQLLAFDPSFYKAYTSMGRVYALMGDYEKALALLEKGASMAGRLPSILAAQGQIYAMTGDRDRALERLRELEALSKTEYVPPPCFAIVRIGLGEYARALDELELACDLRDPRLASLKVHPLYDPLRSDPRFTAILGRLHFA